MRFVAVPAAKDGAWCFGAPLSAIDETVAAMRRRLSFAFALAIAAALALGWFGFCGWPRAPREPHAP